MVSEKGPLLSYINLHVHTEWSNIANVPAVGSVDDHVTTQVRAGSAAAAVSDTGYYFGLRDHLAATRAHEVKPLHGIELPSEAGPVLIYPRTTESLLNFSRSYRPERQLSYLDLERLSSNATIIMQGVYDHLSQAIDHQLYIEFLRSTDNTFHGIIDPSQKAKSYGKLIEQTTGKAVVAHEVRMTSPDQVNIIDAKYKLQGVNDLDKKKFLSEEHMARSGTGIHILYSTHTQEIGRTTDIAQDITAEYPVRGSYRAVDVPEGMDSFDYLEEQVLEAADKQGIIDPVLQERITSELHLIKMLNFSDYILICRDIVTYCKRNSIEYAPLGSGTNSYVLQLLGVLRTEARDLDYTRFLNTVRQEDRPDIDFDVDDEFDEQVQNYILNKYGEATRISTITRLKLPQIRRLSKKHAIPQDEIDIQELIDADLPVGKARSPSAIALAAPLPVFPSDRGPFGQIDKHTLERHGLDKIDLLTHSDTTRIGKIKRYLKSVGESVEVKYDDPAVYSRIFSSDTLGISNLESPHMQNILRLVGQSGRPGFDDIALALSLARMNYSGRQKYFKRMYGLESGLTTYPKIAEILGNTNFVQVYQEQALTIGERIAGLSPRGKNKIKKLWSPDASMDVREAVITSLRQGFAANGLPETVTEELIAQIQAFGTYAFLKGHARNLAKLSYDLAYFAEYHPKVFWMSVLESIAEKPGSKSAPYTTQSYVTDAIRHGMHFVYPSPGDLSPIPKFDGDRIVLGSGLFDRGGGKGETLEAYETAYGSLRNSRTSKEAQIFRELHELGTSFVAPPIEIFQERFLFDPEKEDQWVIGHVEGYRADGELLYVVFDSGRRLNVTAFAQNVRLHPEVYQDEFWYVRLVKDGDSGGRWSIVDQMTIGQ